MQPAVFAKNHLHHLRGAAEIANTDAEQLVTFRSSQRWQSASDLLHRLGRGAVPVLFSVVDHGPAVRFRALLQEVRLSPAPSDPRTEELLRLRPPSTSDEDPWSHNTRTLYAISGCHELDRPLPYDALVKQSDSQPLNRNYAYSYALIYVPEAEGTTAAPVYVGSDITAPPARMHALVSRIVRDTVLTRRLKELHDNQCQLCGTRLSLSSTQAYSEAHHMQPLGRPHNGPDVAENIIVLCPNCHALCDNGAITLSKNVLRAAPEHEIGDKFISYHNQIASSGADT